MAGGRLGSPGAGGCVRRARRAHVAGSQAAIQPRAPAMISAPVHPATQRDGLINHSIINQAAVVGSHRCLHDLMSGSHPALEDSLAGDDAGLVSVFASLVPELAPCSD